MSIMIYISKLKGFGITWFKDFRVFDEQGFRVTG